jgi:alanine racemase
MQSLRRVELDRSAFVDNLDLLKSQIHPNQKICFCVKSNAYGHGLLEMAKLAVEAGVDWLSVIDSHEALMLRQEGISLPILHLGYVHPDDLPKMIELGVRLYVWDMSQARQISEVAQRIQQSAKVHLALETGMGRLGVNISDCFGAIRDIGRLEGVEMEGIAHHYATSDEPDSELFCHQQIQFQEVLDRLKSEGILPPEVHSANSGGALLHLSVAMETLVRVGAGLYGFASDETMQTHLQERGIELRPVLTWKTQLISNKTLPAGSTIGYGATEVLQQNTRVGVIPVGYNEGLDRRLSSIGSVLVAGQRCRILGRVCMNLTMIDLSGLEDVNLGEEVVLIGRQKDEEIRLEEIASVAETIPYEILVHLKGNQVEVIE